MSGANPMRLGIAGLGLAASFMIRAARADPRVSLAACADPRPEPREAFVRAFGAAGYAQFDDLCRDKDVEAIYIATPHRLHADQAIAALRSGKHVLVEKPLALSVADCDRVVAAARESGRGVIVGHTHAFDPGVQALAALAARGDLGPLGLVSTFNYNDFLFRAHRADEFDPVVGGGILFNQVAHQVEMARLVANAPVIRVAAHLGPPQAQRGASGHCAALLIFANGAAASLVFSGCDGFDSDAWHSDVAEGGSRKNHRPGATRRAFEAGRDDMAAHADLAFGARVLPTEQPFLPHFGILLATFADGDVRLAPEGLTIYRASGVEERRIARGAVRAGHGDTLTELWDLVRAGRASRHDAVWGRDTVAILAAIRETARSGAEVAIIERNIT